MITGKDFMLGLLFAAFFTIGILVGISVSKIRGDEICAYAQGAGYEIPTCEEEK